MYLFTADELAAELRVSKALAYKMIRKWNQELREAGYTVIQGRVSREYVKEKWLFGRMCG
ncbi:MAG: DNA-binding protein [Faecalibacterium sp.]|nr:DNA-binding protein [Faecalibacterium sp.]